MSTIIATEIIFHKISRKLEVAFENNECFELPAEYLRVFSPSAEVKGHGSQERQLIAWKKNVNILKIEPVGHYGIKLFFDDGHNTGIYSWDTLYDLGKNYQSNWQDYLNRLKEAKFSRE